MTECWKEYDKNYSVSDLGNILSIRNGILLSQYYDGYGYLQVNLYSKTVKVHTLVANLFISGKTREAFTVNHKNGIKEDNRAVNLEWLTPADNNKHAGLNNLCCSGEAVHTAILTEKNVLEIKNLFVEYILGDSQIGNLFGVSDSTISNIRRGLSWKTVAPELIFKNKSPSSKLKKLFAEDIPVIRQMVNSGLSFQEVSKEFGVHPNTIKGIIVGKTWRNY